MKKRIFFNSKKELQSFRNYVVLDFETTGFPPDAEIIEIGCVKVIDCQIADTYSTLVNPLKVISPFITSITGITNMMVASAPTIYEAGIELYNFIDGLPVVAYNASFDLAFLLAAYEKCSINFKPVRYFDALQMSRKAYPDLKNHKLETIITHFRLSECQTHRALDDARCTMLHLQDCINELCKYE